MTEREKLEREVRRLRGIILKSELALRVAMSASDRAWITKQLGFAKYVWAGSGSVSIRFSLPDQHDHAGLAAPSSNWVDNQSTD